MVFIVAPSPKLPFYVSEESVFVSLPNVGGGVVFEKFFWIVTVFGVGEWERVIVSIVSPCPGLPGSVDGNGFVSGCGYLADFLFPWG